MNTLVPFLRDVARAKALNFEFVQAKELFFAEQGTNKTKAYLDQEMGLAFASYQNNIMNTLVKYQINLGVVSMDSNVPSAVIDYAWWLCHNVKHVEK